MSIDNWRTYWNSAQIAFILEEVFSVEYEDEDLEFVSTVSDLVDTTHKLLKRKGETVHQAAIEHDLIRIVRTLADAEVKVVTAETNLSQLGVLQLSSRSGKKMNGPDGQAEIS